MIRTIILAALAAVSATPAFAHHPLAGAPMETFFHGLLSGVGHPILGFDHLAFVALAGIAAALSGRLLIAPLGYIGGMLLGCLAMLAGLTLPLVEVVIAASLLAMGYVVMSGRVMSSNMVLITFGIVGLFHGSAFGVSIVGQETGYGVEVAVGYLLGLCVVQYLIALMAGFAIIRLKQANQTSPIEARLAGAAITGIGLFLTLENAESAIFSALGIS